MPTKLELYKELFQCQYDGEAVLKAAAMGKIGIGTDGKDNIYETASLPNYVRIPTNCILRALGIYPKMKKRLIIGALGNINATKDQKQFLALVEEEAMLNRGQTTELLRNAYQQTNVRYLHEENVVANLARKRILAVLTQVISFCQDSVVEHK